MVSAYLIYYFISNIKSPGSCGKPLTTISLIVKGEVAARGDWPWLSAIYRKYDWDTSYQCVGSLISNKHVLTGKFFLASLHFKSNQNPSNLFLLFSWALSS